MDFENNKRDGGTDSAPVDGASGNRQMMGSYDLDEHVTIDFSDFFDDYDEEPAKKPGKIKNAEPDEEYDSTSGGTGSPIKKKTPAADAQDGGLPDNRPRTRTFEGPFHPLGAAENSKRLAERIKRENEGVRDNGDFFPDAEDDDWREETAKRRKKAAKLRKQRQRSKNKNKAEKAEKKNASAVVWDRWLQSPSVYFAGAALAVAVILLIFGAVSAGTRNVPDSESMRAEKTLPKIKTDGDGSTLYGILSAYRDFFGHDTNVKNEGQAGNNGEEGTDEPSGWTATPGIPAESTPTPEGPGQTDATATPLNTGEQGTDGTPDEPVQTPGPGENLKIVPATEEDYIVFNLRGDGFSSEKLAAGTLYTSGVGTDSAGELIVGPNGKDLDYGVLRIQNPYNCEGFSLRDILEKPLIIDRSGSLKEPSVLIYYTHTSEGYCLDPEEKVLKNFETCAGYETDRNIVGRGNLLESTAEALGTGVVNLRDVNDTVYENSYASSSALVAREAPKSPSVKLALDLHVNSFEYPNGMRYGPVARKDGEEYAKVVFVITQNPANPNWKDNVRLAMYLIEKLNEKVPGVTLGISLRKDTKYNTTATQFGLLAEIGFEGNLAPEADRTAALLGTVLGEVFA